MARRRPVPVYPRSFADSDGDGVGDLRGIIDHLDHLAWLGVDGLWLNPTLPARRTPTGATTSPTTATSHPDLGTLADLDELIARGRRARHPGPARPRPQPHERRAPVVRRRASRERAPRLVRLARPGAGRRPPNNWQSIFGGPAWTLDEATRPVLPAQLPRPSSPTSNWWNDEVRDEFEAILRCWFDRGVAGFRIDVAHGIVKDRELRDNPAARARGRARRWRRLGQRPRLLDEPPGGPRRSTGAGARSRDEHDPTARAARRDVGPRPRAARALLRAAPTSCTSRSTSSFVGRGASTPSRSRAIVARTEALLPGGRGRSGRCPTTTSSASRRAGRAATRTRPRCALMLLLTLRGTPVLYYGDEIGMRGGRRAARPRPRPGRPARRPERPRPRRRADADAVERAPGAGFTAPGVEPGCRSATWRRQRRRPARGPGLGAAPRAATSSRCAAPSPTSARAPYTPLDAPEGAWAYRRGERRRRRAQPLRRAR